MSETKASHELNELNELAELDEMSPATHRRNTLPTRDTQKKSHKLKSFLSLVEHPHKDLAWFEKSGISLT